MTDEELGREMYERAAIGWPNPIGWNNLHPGTQKIWIARAMQKVKND